MQWFLLLAFIPYLYYLLKIFRGLKKISSYYPGSETDLFISIVIPCRNEEKNLPTVLSSIAAQDYNNSGFELIIIDDDSSDSTFLTASAYNGIRNMKVLKNNGSGKKAAIRRGVEASEGEIIVTTDADCTMGEKWLSAIASFYSEHHPDMVICPVRIRATPGFPGRFQELEFLSLQGVTAGAAAAGKPVMCNGSNLSFLKESYNRYSGELHDELVSGDDIFLLHSLKKDNAKRILWLESPEAIVTTKPVDSLRSFLRQRARWISKAGSYTDRQTISLAISTFVAVLLQAAITAGCIFNNTLLLMLPVALIIKSVPDFMILSNTAKRYGNKKILRWFLPSQIIYPFYVIAVVFSALLTPKHGDR